MSIPAKTSRNELSFIENGLELACSSTTVGANLGSAEPKSPLLVELC